MFIANHIIRISSTKVYVLFLLLYKASLISQTSLSPGDIAVIAFKTNGNTQSGNDAVKFVTLVDLECNTQFIVTDNNWNSSTLSWSCNDDEFGVQVTCNTAIAAGSVFYLDADASTGTLTCSGGSVTKTNLGNPWGTNYGFNSGGDNVYILQGTRAAPLFIFAFKHVGAFAPASCASKDNASLPAGLTVGTSAIVMASSKDQWNYNCTTNSGLKATIRSAIANNSNWINNTNHVWDESNCIFSVAPAALYGVMAVSGAGCGCLANCQLAYSGGVNCGGVGVAGDCTAGYQNMSTTITVPGGCTFSVLAQMRPRNYGCSSSGADGACQGCDNVKVDIPGGPKIFQQGAGNAAIADSYSLTGPGSIVVSGSANRADEIITYSVTISPCACLVQILPIELAAFTAKMLDRSVELSWMTMSEKDNSYFTIERSSDTDEWEKTALVNGLGNSSTPFHYTIYDSSPLNGISYYRLKQTNKDNSFTYSTLVSVSNMIDQKKIIKRLDVFGRELNEDSTGLMILIYDNGETRKIFKYSN